MNTKTIIRLITAAWLCLLLIPIGTGAESTGKSANPISWKNCLSQKGQFYATDEAIRIADNVLLFQRDSGGWPKGIDMARTLSENEKAGILKAKSKKDSTLDNGATHTQLRYLVKVYNATKIERFKQGFLKGVEYLLKAQYPNGGWPQFYPPEGHPQYSRFITFNDGAMIGAMSILSDIAKKKPQYAFIDEDLCKKAADAVQKAIECILKCQIVVDGKRTAWCQQHDQENFEPRPARIYEKISICGCESVDIVKFLMDIDRPGPEVIEAIQSAVLWFDNVKLTGIRQIEKPDQSTEDGRDKVIIEDANALPLWARFYQIKTNRPIFCGRDGIIKDSLAEIEQERRTGYAWYGDWPAELLSKDYPAWQKKWTPGKNVLGKDPSENKVN
jgi:PelA/Pel-15E family pectate lyase